MFSDSSVHVVRYYSSDVGVQRDEKTCARARGKSGVKTADTLGRDRTRGFRVRSGVENDTLFTESFI